MSQAFPCPRHTWCHLIFLIRIFNNFVFEMLLGVKKLIRNSWSIYSNCFFAVNCQLIIQFRKIR